MSPGQAMNRLSRDAWAPRPAARSRWPCWSAAACSPRMAGPALSLHTRTQALHQTMAGLTATTKTVQVTANWGDFTGTPVQNGVGTSQNMTWASSVRPPARSATASRRSGSRSRRASGPA